MSWVRPLHVSHYRVKVKVLTEIYATALEIPDISGEMKNTETVKIEYILNTTALISPIGLLDDRLICIHLDDISTVSLNPSGENPSQLIENFKKSAKKYPLYAELDDSFLVRYYWIRDSESFVHSIVRYIVSRIQVPAYFKENRSGYSLVESDNYGRYVARYDTEKKRNRIIGTKRRMRYLDFARSTTAGKIKYIPNDQTQFVIEMDRGVISFDSNQKTSMRLNLMEIGKEEAGILFRLARQERLSNSYRSRMTEVFSDGYRRVLPWETIQ